MSTTPLSTAREARDLYEMLSGRTVEVSSDYEILRPDEEFRCCVVFFSDAMGAVCTARIMDLDLRAYAGMALQLVPAAGTQDHTNDGCLDDNYIGNVYEVLDVFSSLFSEEGAPHVPIGLMHTPGEELPANEYKMVVPYVERRDSIPDIRGYGKGRFRIICFNQFHRVALGAVSHNNM